MGRRTIAHAQRALSPAANSLASSDKGKRGMKHILKPTIITPGNSPRIAVLIVPPDLCEAIRPGIKIGHYAFINRHEQHGYVIVCHTTRRAGICFTDERTQWGRWDEESDIIMADDGRQLTRMGWMKRKTLWGKPQPRK
jgi:hypothetical protein